MKKTLWTIIIFTLFLGGLSEVKAYVVQSGDTMWKIAQNADLSLPELAIMNPQVDNLDLIYVGETIHTLFVEQMLGGTRPTSPVAGSTYTLAGSGLTSSATSIVLQKLTIPQTGYELLDADFSDIFYVTLEAGNQKRQEIASCTTVTQGSGTTATLSGCTRGLLPFYPFTADSDYRFSHGGGTSVIFSDPPQLFEQYVSKNSSSTISNVWKFTVFPEMNSAITPTTSEQFATKRYADLIANQGAATSSETIAGIIEQATRIEMASSTAFDANNPHAINSEMATSTPGNNATLQVVISENDGKLSQSWLDLAEAFAVTGGWTFSGLSTFTATSTFATTTIDEATITSSTITTQLTLNGVDANQLVDGSEISVHSHSNQSSLIIASTTASTVGNNSAELSLALGSIPANFLGTGNAVRFTAYISNIGVTPSDNIKISLFYGGNSVATMTLTELDAATVSISHGKIEGWLVATGATNSQYGVISITAHDSGITKSSTNSNPQANGNANGTSATDSTSAQDLEIRIDYQVAEAGSTITVQNFLIEGLAT